MYWRKRYDKYGRVFTRFVVDNKAYLTKRDVETALSIFSEQLPVSGIFRDNVGYAATITIAKCTARIKNEQ